MKIIRRSKIIVSFFLWHLIVNAQDYLPKSDGEIIKHMYYTLSYSDDHEQAIWVWYSLDNKNLIGTTKRKDNFREDPYVSTGSSQLIDYKGSGYDRGHLAPAGDMKMSTISMSESFYLSNISPQSPSLNRGAWRSLETQGREWAKTKKMYVYTGGILNKELNKIGINDVSVPKFFYKIFYDYEKNKALGFVLPNQRILGELKDYVRSIDFVEELTGINFFHHLNDTLEQKIEKDIDLSSWTFSNIGTTIPKKNKNNRRISVTCRGLTKKKLKCKNKTLDLSGYCYLHQSQRDNTSIPLKQKNNLTSQCIGITKSGSQCKRKAKTSSNYCWQHQ